MIHAEEGNVGAFKQSWIDDVSVPFKLESWQKEMLLHWYREPIIVSPHTFNILRSITALNLPEGDPMSQSDIDQLAHECAVEDAAELVAAAETKPYGVPLFFNHFQWSKDSGYTFLVTYENPVYHDVMVTVDLCDSSRPSDVAEEANVLLLKYFGMPTECPVCGAPMALPLYAERVIEDRSSIVQASYACGFEFCKSSCGPCENGGCHNQDLTADALDKVHALSLDLADAINAIDPFKLDRFKVVGKVEDAKDAAQDLWDALAEFYALFEDERR